MDSGLKTIAMFPRYVQSTREDIGRKDVEKELAMLPQGEAIMKSFEEEFFPEAYRRGYMLGHQLGTLKALQQEIQQGLRLVHGFLLDLIRERVGPVPPEIEDKLRRVDDLDALERLSSAAVRVATVEEFEALLDSAHHPGEQS